MTSDSRAISSNGPPAGHLGAELPIACSLDAAQLSVRLAEISAIGREALHAVDTSRTGERSTLRFKAAEGTRARLESIIAAEARCCPFIRFTLSEDQEGLVLAIEVPDGAGPVLGELVAAFSA